MGKAWSMSGLYRTRSCCQPPKTWPPVATRCFHVPSKLPEAISNPRRPENFSRSSGFLTESWKQTKEASGFTSRGLFVIPSCFEPTPAFPDLLRWRGCRLSRGGSAWCRGLRRGGPSLDRVALIEEANDFLGHVD